MFDDFDFGRRRAVRVNEEAKKLQEEHTQQAYRAGQALRLSEAIMKDIGERSIDAQVTLKGEAVDVLRGDRKLVVTANGDGTFTVDRGQKGPTAVAQKLKEEKLSADATIDLIDAWLTAN